MDVETGSGCLLKEFMRGKAYPLRPEQWPDVVLKGMEILNRNNWFPFCTWILELPVRCSRSFSSAAEGIAGFLPPG